MRPIGNIWTFTNGPTAAGGRPHRIVLKYSESTSMVQGSHDIATTIEILYGLLLLWWMRRQ